MTAVAYGIDFGTTNSAVAVAHADRPVEVVPAAGTDPLLRSVVYLHRSGTRSVGEEALSGYLTTGSQRTRCGRCDLVDVHRGHAQTECRQHRSGSGCLDSRLLTQLKADLADDAFASTHSWAQDLVLTELVAVVLKRLKTRADRHTGQDVRRVALGRPVRFAGTDNVHHARLQRTAEARLHQAARAAGFDDVRLVPEPQAALAPESLDDGLLICTDFGGGTFDIAVLEKDGDRAEVLALGGVPVGGEDFDARLFQRFLAEPLGLDAAYTNQLGHVRHLPHWLRKGFTSLAGLKLLLTDPQVAAILREYQQYSGGARLQTLSELLYGGQAWALHRAVEQAKIELSAAEGSTISLVRRPHLDINVEVTREQFEAEIEADLQRVERCIAGTLADAGVRPEDVDLVTRTGGSSRIPAFVARLEHMFPLADIAEREPFTTVVRGLAEYAHAEWVSVPA